MAAFLQRAFCRTICTGPRDDRPGHRGPAQARPLALLSADRRACRPGALPEVRPAPARDRSQPVRAVPGEGPCRRPGQGREAPGRRHSAPRSGESAQVRTQAFPPPGRETPRRRREHRLRQATGGARPRVVRAVPGEAPRRGPRPLRGGQSGGETLWRGQRRDQAPGGPRQKQAAQEGVARGGAPMPCYGTAAEKTPWPWFKRSTQPSVIDSPVKKRSVTCCEHETAIEGTISNWLQSPMQPGLPRVPVRWLWSTTSCLSIAIGLDCGRTMFLHRGSSKLSARSKTIGHDQELHWVSLDWGCSNTTA